MPELHEIQVKTEAHKLMDETNHGVNIIKELQAMPADERKAIIHAMEQAKEATPNAFPNLAISDDANGQIVSQSKDGKSFDAGVWSSSGAMAQAEHDQHPEREAHKIEDIAKKALGGDEQAKKDLSSELHELQKEKPEFVEGVYREMKSDGDAHLGTAPKAVIQKDEKGNVTAIEFSKYMGLEHTSVDLRRPKTPEEKAQEAQDARAAKSEYVHRVLGGDAPKAEKEKALEEIARDPGLDNIPQKN